MPFVEIPFVIEANYQGWRLDRYLKQKLGRASRTRVQQIIRDSLVQEEGRQLKPSSRVRAGQEIRIRKEEISEPSGLPDKISILHNRDGVLVVDKPAGLPVHPTARYYQGTLTSILARDHRDESGRRPDPAHRLDRETSGVLVCGQTKEVTKALKALFVPSSAGLHKTARISKARVLPIAKERPIHKSYLAIIQGSPSWTKKRLTYSLALLHEHRVRIRMSVVADNHPKAQIAATSVEVIQRYSNEMGDCFSLVECHLETGRQHQIRAHLQAEGFPIVGDKIYGSDETIFVRFTEENLSQEDHRILLMPRHALHAWKIAFYHPFTNELVEVESPIPEDMLCFLECLTH